MSSKETINTPFGPMSRSIDEGGNSVLLQLPGASYPNPEPCCAVCPAASWYVTLRDLRCWCAERSYVSWVSDHDPVLVCDDCERLLMEEAQAETPDGSSAAGSTQG